MDASKDWPVMELKADISAMIIPALREDLRLHDRASDGGHHLIYDQLAHRYYEISPSAFEILQNWRGPIRMDDFSLFLSSHFSRTVSAEEILDIAKNLDASGLLSEPLQGWKKIYDMQQKSRKGVGEWLLHNYLFIRIPLVRPDAFLRKTLPVAEFLASRFMLVVIALIGLVGLYLASRQWNSFTGTFLHFFSVEGAAGYLCALAIVKLFHELGHAYAARHFGCRVPTMGVAFMVLAPVLYTDVTDTWRLKSRRERMIVSAAGMAVEFSIAAIALFIWAVLPEGIWKSISYFLAAVSLIGGILINASPLMRFDGYYLLSDFWQIPNLQTRAFSLLRWRIREFLFNLGHVCPEAWSSGRRHAVIIYAVSVCLYRLALFIGIALLVYHMTFKILGILLFAVEIIWFVLWPIWTEFKVWWALRASIALKARYKITLPAAGFAIAAFFMPWPYRIEIPAIAEPLSAQKIVAPYNAQIMHINVQVGNAVKAGDTLFSLYSPKLDADIASAQVRLTVAKERYSRRAASALDRDASLLLEKEIEKTEEKLAGLLRLKEDLSIKATLDGTVREIAPDMHQMRWVQRGEELASIVDRNGVSIRGYVPEDYHGNLKDQARGKFIPESLLSRVIDLQIQSIATASSDAIDLIYLTSTYGGPVAVSEDRERGLIPVVSQYQVRMQSENVTSSLDHIQRGIVLIEAEPESYAMRLLRRTAAILIRESGF